MSYQGLKKAYNSILPRRIRRAIEPFSRSILAMRYRGDNVVCPVCTSSFRSFIALENSSKDHVCPKCGSIERQRLLWLFLESTLAEMRKRVSEPNVLHFSPNRFFEKRLRRQVGSNYKSTDYETKDCDLQLDITDMKLPDDSQDLIICYHVLEHIPDDKAAMSELGRILKDNGILITQVPHREQETYEDLTITSQEERKEHFGQEDHVRWYGRENFVSRLENAGFKVDQLTPASTMDRETIDRYKLKEGEIIFLCYKSN